MRALISSHVTMLDQGQEIMPSPQIRADFIEESSAQEAKARAQGRTEAPISAATGEVDEEQLRSSINRLINESAHSKSADV
ncbi:MAG: hypothetical protein R2827_11655 [Bdellovibrionales bacterium]